RDGRADRQARRQHRAGQGALGAGVTRALGLSERGGPDKTERRVGPLGCWAAVTRLAENASRSGGLSRREFPRLPTGKRSDTGGAQFLGPRDLRIPELFCLILERESVCRLLR